MYFSKNQLWTMSAPESTHIVRNSYYKISTVACKQILELSDGAKLSFSLYQAQLTDCRVCSNPFLLIPARKPFGIFIKIFFYL